MKKMMILMLMSGTVFAQGPTYNFNFYNGDSGTSAPTLNGAPMQAPATPVQGPVVREIVKEREEKKESIIGFQFGYGIVGDKGSGDQYSQLAAGLVFNVSRTAHIRLSYVHDQYEDDWGEAHSSNGINVGVGTYAELIGPLGFVTEIEGQYSKGADITAKYVGLRVGPQLELGNLQLNMVGRLGYQHTETENFSGFNNYQYGMTNKSLAYGIQLNVGFKM